MASPLGFSFVPTDDKTNNRGGITPGVQAALKVLSLRLPKQLGNSAIAPRNLLLPQARPVLNVDDAIRRTVSTVLQDNPLDTALQTPSSPVLPTTSQAPPEHFDAARPWLPAPTTGTPNFGLSNPMPGNFREGTQVAGGNIDPYFRTITAPAPNAPLPPDVSPMAGSGQPAATFAPTAAPPHADVQDLAWQPGTQPRTPFNTVAAPTYPRPTNTVPAPDNDLWLRVANLLNGPRLSRL